MADELFVLLAVPRWGSETRCPRLKFSYLPSE